jgi:hypothetical protein
VGACSGGGGREPVGAAAAWARGSSGGRAAVAAGVGCGDGGSVRMWEWSPREVVWGKKETAVLGGWDSRMQGLGFTISMTA